ncbi:MAG: hypothetical protein AVDCRST_MAG93-9304 [uncultured Chloroflexia bacterium]|uniref:Uncharacterized protein n=1 Tax=uncultured Chloroflexia bacterium TaxID=1672391 RepID=A0A6J4NAW7_9CHLR|nr:MAG: hypothetical protein AVDCRST_MAG93-9304 [uncultured Chloroflexia bacterium]
MRVAARFSRSAGIKLRMPLGERSLYPRMLGLRMAGSDARAGRGGHPLEGS